MKAFSAFVFLGIASGADWNGWVCTSNTVTVTVGTPAPISPAPFGYVSTSATYALQTGLPAIQNATLETASSTFSMFSITKATNYSITTTFPTMDTGKATPCTSLALGGVCNASLNASPETALLPSTTKPGTTTRQSSANAFTMSPLPGTGSAYTSAAKPTMLVSTGAAAHQLKPNLWLFTWSSSWGPPSFAAAALLLVITSAA